MILQIAIGTVLILVTTLVAGVAFLALEQILIRRAAWFMRPPHALRLLVLLGLAVIAVLAIVTAGVWLWAITFLALGIFGTVESSVYFSIVAFTTLGFGDILLPHEWRLLGGMTAVNGLLMIGLLGAILVEVLRRVRLIQSGGRDRMG